MQKNRLSKLSWHDSLELFQLILSMIVDKLYLGRLAHSTTRLVSRGALLPIQLKQLDITKLNYFTKYVKLSKIINKRT